jgi:hypothetical protein
VRAGAARIAAELPTIQPTSDECIGLIRATDALQYFVFVTTHSMLLAYYRPTGSNPDSVQF